MVLLAFYSVFLSKLSGQCVQNDIIVRSPLAVCPHGAISRVIAMFVQTLALPTYPYGDNSLPHYLTDVKETALSALEAQYFPLEHLTGKVPVHRDTSTKSVGTGSVFPSHASRSVCFSVSNKLDTLITLMPPL
ncbi:hypothetical protein I9X38_12565 [Bacillus mojavensis]|nr:hypothetical protein I9X38_12565 [Bacillus mojavensis]